MNTPDVIFLYGKKEDIRWIKEETGGDDCHAQTTLLCRVIRSSVGDLGLYTRRLTPFDLAAICGVIVNDIQSLLSRYGESLFDVPRNGEPPEIPPPSISIGGGHITTRQIDHYDNKYTRGPAGIIYDLCYLRMSEDLNNFPLNTIARLSWNISGGVTLFVRENLFSLFGPMEPQSPSTQKLLPESMEALILIANMVLSNASKEEIDRAANYAVSAIAVEKSVSDCVEAKRANGVDELMKKYYPT